MQTAYEAIFIMDAVTPDDQATATVNKYTGVLTNQGAEIDDIDRWEPRRLAYPIKGRREGLYVAVNFRSEPAARDEMDRIFRISDDTLRHLIIKVDKRADRFPSKLRTESRERTQSQNAPSGAAPLPVTDLSASATGGGVELAEGVSDNHERVGEPMPEADGTLADTVADNE